jgi:hypothetical protein
MDANSLADMDIDEIALCRKGAHAGAKFVIQKTAERESEPVDRMTPAMVRTRFAVAVLKVRKNSRS